MTWFAGRPDRAKPSELLSREMTARRDAVTCSARCRVSRNRKPDIDRIDTVEASALLDGQHYLGGLEFHARYCLA
jgi:hypothetical protein